MHFGQSIFRSGIQIPADAEIVFVSDLFVEDYVGGAELTSEALIGSSPLKVFKLHSRDVTVQTLEQGMGKYWIFGNFSQIHPNLLPSIIGNLQYSILEYDYKYCRFRSPEKHLSEAGMPCTCANDMHGKIVSSFFMGADNLFWMSEKQQERYHNLFPFLQDKSNRVLSSVFDETTFATLKLLRNKYESSPKKGWIVLGSNSWVKGAEAAEQWCKETGKDYEVVWNLPYDQLLEKLAQAEGFVYLPAGGDTCPRMVIEAKLLGCKLQLNDYVQHATEEWFATDDIEEIESYLYKSREIFWNMIRGTIHYVPTISGYTTTYNCVSQGYPFEQSIKSMLQFCDEVCVVDGGSTDGTIEKLEELQSKEPGLRVKVIPRDWDHPRFAVFDGLQKAEARRMCTKDFCWQMDSDEIVHENDGPKVKELAKKFPKGVNLCNLPVVEYWGGFDKVRLDVNPWKWRLSKNLPSITHGIPGSLRKTDANGNLYAAEGTDGCDMIDSNTLEPIQHIGFYSQEAHAARMAALNGDVEQHQQYETWLNNIVVNLPTVYHFSWFDLERKIKTYRGYWGKHWKSLYDIEISDTAENNMMFDKPWSEVSDEDIKLLASRLKSECGGWIWHKKWDGRQTPSIKIRRSPPSLAFEMYGESK